MKKSMKIGILVVVLSGFAVFVAACFYFYNIAIARTSKEFLNDNEDLEATTVVTDEDKKYEWFFQKDFQDIELNSQDGLKLHGYYLAAEEPALKTVILAHGYSSEGKDMVSYARFFHDDLGYNVLIPDNRGHGKSEGNFIGFGWIDRKDYLQWIDYAVDMVGEEAEIVLMGVSMGGATVLMTSGEELPQNVKAVISDCAYTSVKEELAYQLKRMYHLPSFPIVQGTSALTKIRAGYFFGEASAVEQVKKSVTPTLFIHGDADTFVPFEMVNELYEACNSEKELFVAEGAIHGTAYRDDKEGYEKTVIGFLNKYVD